MGKCQFFPHQTGNVELKGTGVVRCSDTVNLHKNGFYEKIPMHFQLTVDWKDADKKSQHEATAVWAEQVTDQSSFKVCAAIAGRHFTDNYKSPHVHFIAYQIGFTSSKENLAGGHVDLQPWYTGSRCATINAPKQLVVTNHTKVHVSVEHQRNDKNTDAMVSWSEIVRTKAGKMTIRLCARELQNFDGKHEKIRLHWLVVDGIETPQLSETGEMVFSKRMIDGGDEPTVCHERRQFNYLYPVLPEFSVIVSATPIQSQLAMSTNVWSTEGIVAWVEQSATGYLRVCVKRIRSGMVQGAVRVSYSVFPKLCGELGKLFYNGNCYSFVGAPDKYTHEEMKQQCKAQNAETVAIESAADAHFIEKMSTTLSADNNIWLNYYYHDGKWMHDFVDAQNPGKEIVYTN
jgi:hypothetical protein